MKKRKRLVLSLGALAIVGTAIGFTIAVSHDSSVMNNEFQISDFETQFVETFNSPNNWKTCETVSKEIKVKNNTGADIVARIKLEEEWTASDGMGLPLVSNGSGERMAIINMTQNSGWTLDGTYYYSPTLAAGETSTSVISGVTLNCAANLAVDARYANANYKLSAKVETIQAEMAATEWHKISVLKQIGGIAQQMRSLAPSSNSTPRVRKFLQADSLGVDGSNPMNVISDDYNAESNTKTYMWYDEDSSTMYWYSDADDVYLTGTGVDSGPFWPYNDISGLYNWNTSRVTGLNNVFEYYNGTSLHGLEKWDVSHVTSMFDGFYLANNLTDISALSRWDISSLQNISYLFNGNYALEDATPLAGWKTSRLTTMNMSFRGTKIGNTVCALSSWDVSHVTVFNEMFDTTNITDYRCLEPWKFPSGVRNDIFSNTTREYWPSWYQEWYP